VRAAIAELSTTARTYGVAVWPPVSYGEGLSGSWVEYELLIENTGGFEDSFTIVLTSENGWEITADTNLVGPLPPGGSAQLSVQVQIPSGTEGGFVDAGSVGVSSQSDPLRIDRVILYTLANRFQFNATVLDDSLEGAANDIITYTVLIENVGNASDIYQVQVEGNSWQTQASNEEILVGAGESVVEAIQVHIPNNAIPGDTDTASVTFTSGSDLSVFVTIYLHSVVREYRIFLPLANR
jgi:uncharacterized membrane protein